MPKAIQTVSVRKQKSNARVVKIPLPIKSPRPQQYTERTSQKRGVGITIADATASLVRIFREIPEEIPKAAQVSDPLYLDLALLKESRDQFQNLYENAPIGDFSVTLGGKISMANKFACELLGYKRDELIGRSVIDFYADTKQGKEKALQLHKHIMKGNEVTNEELEMQKADGTSIWTNLTVQLIRNAEGEPVGRRGLVVDITEKKRAKEELEKTKHMYEDLWEDAPIAYYRVNSDGDIVMVNKTMQDMIGYSEKELQKMKFTQLYSKKSLVRAKQLFVEKFKKGRRISNEEMTQVRKDGKEISVLLSTNPEKNEEGDVVASRSMVVDITEKKTVERALQESESKYYNLFTNANDAIFIIDPERDEIFDVNPKACSMLKYSRKGLLSLTVSAIHPREMPEFRAFAQSVLREGSGWTNELTCLTRGGKTLPVEMSASVINIAGNSCILALVRDITKRKCAEKKLKISEAKYRSLYDNIPTAYLLVGSDGIIKETNKAAQDMFFRYSHEKLMRMNPLTFCAEESKEKIQFLFDVFRQGVPIENEELVFAGKKGEEFNVLLSVNEIKDDQGSIAGNRWLITDITKRIQMGEKLKSHTNELEAAKIRLEYAKAKDEATLSSIADGVISTDVSGKIMMINKATEDMLGWKNKEVVGKFIHEAFPIFKGEGKNQALIPPEKRPESIAYASGKRISTEIVSSGSGSSSGDSGRCCSFVRKDGKQLQVAITAAPVFLKKEKIGVIETFRDISKELEIDRAKSEFVSLASHQLRTPPTIISLYSELLFADKENQLNKKQLQSLREIDNANHRMAELINAILNVSRIELGTLKVNLRSIKLTNLVDTLLQEISPKIEKKGLFIKKRYGNTISSIKIDPVLVSMALQNLLLNAIEYTPKRGKIKLVIKKQKNDIMFAISDTGCGIPKRQQGKIFTKLFRADNAQKVKAHGTGLGLYITKSIVEKMGGKIWFESVFNKGSTFCVLLPTKNYKAIES